MPGLALILAGALAVLAVAVPTAAGQRPATVNAGVQYRTIGLAPGESRTVRVRCPEPYVAWGSTPSDVPAGMVVEESSPGPGLQSWTYKLRNDDPSEMRRIILKVECLAPRGAGRLRAPRIPDRFVELEPGETKTTNAPCPPGTTPAGPSEGQAPAGGNRRARAAALGGARLLGVQHTARGFRFTHTNDGQTTETRRVGGRCVRETFGGRSISVARPRASVTAAPGNSTITARCGQGQVPMGGNVSFPPGSQAEVTGQALTPEAELRTAFANAGSQPVSASLQLVCLRARLAFVRGYEAVVDTTVGPIQITQGY